MKPHLLAVLLALGCGSASGEFSGSAGAFGVRSALLHESGGGVYVSLESEDASQACAHWAQRLEAVPNLGLRILSGVTITARDYPVFPVDQFGQGLEGGSAEYNIEAGPLNKALDGHITLDSISFGSDAGATGHFELQFNAGSASGWFDAEPCP